MQEDVFFFQSLWATCLFLSELCILHQQFVPNSVPKPCQPHSEVLTLFAQAVSCCFTLLCLVPPSSSFAYELSTSSYSRFFLSIRDHSAPPGPYL